MTIQVMGATDSRIDGISGGACLGHNRFRAPVSWEYFGKQTPQIPKTTDHETDGGCQLTCLNVMEGHWLDRFDPIPKPCVAGSSPAGGAFVMSRDIGDRWSRHRKPKNPLSRLGR